MSDEIENMDREIKGYHLMRVYRYRIENPAASLTETCRQLDLPYSTVHGWIKSGVFESYIAELHDPRSGLSQAIALNELPGIVEFMAQIASGRKTIRGGNPQAAAEFVLKVAQAGAHQEPPDNRPQLQVNNIYMPELKRGEIAPSPYQVIDT